MLPLLPSPHFPWLPRVQKSETNVRADKTPDRYIRRPHRCVRSQIYQSILEAFASEHSARMVAMQNATDNAGELIGELTLDLNKARQETITAELLDLIGGIAALEGK